MTEFRETETFDFEGPVGRLEGILSRPPAGSPAKAAAVICHAHPLHGGMMHFKVIFRAAKALQNQGIAVLRFNFRGVGRSEGQHDRGIGEQADARAALSEVERRLPGIPLLLGGFSFGSAMAVKVALVDARVRAVFVLGFPITRVDSTEDLARVRQPRLFVQGGNDEYGSGAVMAALVAPLSQPVHFDILEGADHFFTGRLDDLQARIEAWAALKPWEMTA